MNGDFKVIISISHHQISFEFWRKGAGDMLQPIKTQANPSGGWPVPLSVFIKTNGSIIIGKDATIAANQGTPNAFTNIFERMSNPNEYYDYGQKKPLSYLLLDTAEVVFRDFFERMLFSSKGRLEQNRSTMPIIFVCEDDIHPNEKAHLRDLFLNSGYGCVAVEDLKTQIDHYTKREKVNLFSQSNVLVVRSYEDDLLINLFDMRGQRKPCSSKLSGGGIDPRLERVVQKIWEKIYYKAGGGLRLENERKFIEEAAKSFLLSSEPGGFSSLVLSDGRQYTYNIFKSDIVNIPGGSMQWINEIRYFLSANQASPEDTLLVLYGDTSKNSSVVDSLIGLGFSKIEYADDAWRFNVLRAIIDEPIPVQTPREPVSGFDNSNLNPHQPSYGQDGNILGAQVSSLPNPQQGATQSLNNGGLSFGTGTSGFNEKINLADIASPSNQQKPSINVQPNGGMQPQTKPSLQREWRQVTAKVNGMIRSAFYDKALAELEPFLKLCEQQGVTDLIPLVGEKIAAVKKELGKRPNNTEEIAKLKRDWRPLKASSNGKIRIGKAQEAKAEFEAFLKRCEKVDAKDLIAEVKVELDKIPTTPPPPPLPLAGDLSREWRNLKATSNGKVRSGKAQDAIKEFEAFLKKCEQTGAKDLITLVKAEIAKAKGGGSTTPPPPPVTSPTNGGSLVREWKQTKAAASGKIRAQKNAEAKKILQDFLAKCTAANSKDIIAEVKAELAKVK